MLPSTRVAAFGYAALTVVVVAFQVALALGAPWGSFALGGAYPGRFPPPLRLAAIGQAVILIGLAGVVAARAGVALRRWAGRSRRLVWVVVGFTAVSLVLNLITPSAGERMVWAPVAAGLLATSLRVAIGAPGASAERREKTSG